MKLNRFTASALMSTCLCVAVNTPAFAEPDTKVWPVVKEAFFAQREIQEVDFIKIEAHVVLKAAHKYL